MWLRRNIDDLFRFGQCTVVDAPEEYGIPYIVDELRSSDKRVVWIDLNPEDADDPIRQGDQLAVAVQRAFSARLFGKGLSYAYGLSVIRKHLDLLTPLTFVLTNSDYGRSLAQALLTFDYPQVSVLTQFGNLPTSFHLPASAHVVGKIELRLTLDEALDLARGHLPPAKIEELFEESRGAYETFRSSVRRELDLPGIKRPTPNGSVIVGNLPAAETPGLIDALLGGGRCLAAFELCVEWAPDRVPEVVARAGQQYFAEGLFDEFWRQISKLPAWVLAREEVAYWRYAAALATNRQEELEQEVNAYLMEHRAPNLQALKAISTPTSSMLEEVSKAHSCSPNAVTTRALGFALAVNGEPTSAIETLVKANSLAKSEEDPHLVIATECELAVACQMAGKYAEAYHWASRALRSFNAHDMKEELRRLFILGELAYAALLIGRTEAVVPYLENMEVSPELFGIPSLEGIISTLADFAVLRGDLPSALYYAQANMKHSPDEVRAFGVWGVIRVLLESDRIDDALEMGRDIFYTTRYASPAERYRASLSLGAATARKRPLDAIPYLKEAQEGFLSALSAPYLAQASILMAATLLAAGRRESASSALARGKIALEELSQVGWRVLGGRWQYVEEAWDLWNESSTPLELTFLGGRKVRIDHQTKEYSLRWSEILAVLAFHQEEGIGGERLCFLLSGDEGNISTLKSNLSRMRKDIPLASKPYRIAMPFKADFMELIEALKDGRVKDALELYKGPLLPQSEAPFIVDLRTHLEETLRQAALNSGDAEVLLSLAHKLYDDLELWEATGEKLSPNDPLLPLVKAHVKRVQRSWGA